ncbi:MAG: stage III sporulation protein AE [Clostridia bacterium]|nr:stage III sporulation protein AE [Clostridia bacterium]
MTAETWEMYTQQMQSSGAADLPQKLPRNVQALLESLDLDALDPSSYTELGFGQMAQMLSDLMYAQSAGPKQTVGMLMGVVLLCALFSGLDGAVGSVSLRRTYQGVAVLAAGGAVLVPLFALFSRVWEAVQQVTVFLCAYVPVYGAILLTGGRGASALSYQTTLLAAVQLLLWLVRGVVFPFLLVSLALGCTGSVSEGFCLDRLSGTFHKAILWMLGLFSTLFSGLLSLQQMVAAAGDSLGSRVVKFSLASFVPVVGGVLSEAYNTVIGCGGLLRSTVGAFGLLSVALMVLPPLLSCVCWSVGLHLAGGAAALFGLTPLDTLCRTAAGAVKVLIAVLAVFALLMILSTSVVAFASGR